MAKSKSNDHCVILMKKSTSADYLAWVEAHYDKLDFTLTCKVGPENKDKIFKMLERKLRNERIAVEKRKKSK